MKKYHIQVNGTKYEVEVEEAFDGSTTQKDTVTALKETVNDANTQTTRETGSIAAGVTSTMTTTAASIAAPAADATSAANATSAAATPVDVASIIAQMPGIILKVNISTGDIVKKGQVLLVLEAMKMENELVAPIDGRIVAVNVEKGKVVNAGELLLSLDRS